MRKKKVSKSVQIPTLMMTQMIKHFQFISHLHFILFNGPSVRVCLYCLSLVPGFIRFGDFILPNVWNKNMAKGKRTKINETLD